MYVRIQFINGGAGWSDAHGKRTACSFCYPNATWIESRCPDPKLPQLEFGEKLAEASAKDARASY